MIDSKTVVQTFYDLLSNPSSKSHVNAFKAIVADNWESISDYSGKNKSCDDFLEQVEYFATLIPDLNWAVEEMLQKGNRVIVRSRATGTPNGELFGVDGKGKSFEILTIDIHTLEGGKLIQSYHVEDWKGAINQLSAS